MMIDKHTIWVYIVVTLSEQQNEGAKEMETNRDRLFAALARMTAEELHDFLHCEEVQAILRSN